MSLFLVPLFLSVVATFFVMPVLRMMAASVRPMQVLGLFPRMLVAGSEENDRCDGGQKRNYSALHWFLL